MNLDFLAIAVVAVAVLAVLSVALLVGARRRRGPLPPAPDEGGTALPGAPSGPLAQDEGPRSSDTAVLDRPTGPALEELTEPVAPTLERPEPVLGRMARLRQRLARSNSAIGQGLLALLARDTIDEDTWEEIEDTLLLADIGAGASAEIIDGLRREVATLGTRDPEQVRSMLRTQLLAAVEPGMDRSLAVDRHIAEGRPAVVLVVGVNGTGKTTTVGKLARVLVAEDKDVLLGAADTFRAAAADQLTTWGERVGVPTVRSDTGADPASVAFDAVRAGIEAEVDVVLIDTAGRLQNKVGLMDELGKIKRVIAKHGPVDEVLLVLDATTGQNGMNQARVFSDVVDVTGIVLTKLDGTAKGGIVVAVQRALGVPVKLVGLGEGPDDLAPFEPETFVDALLS